VGTADPPEGLSNAMRAYREALADVLRALDRATLNPQDLEQVSLAVDRLHEAEDAYREALRLWER